MTWTCRQLFISRGATGTLCRDWARMAIDSCQIEGLTGVQPARMRPMLDGSSATAACGAPPAVGCQIRFGIEDGVPLRTAPGASQTWGQPQKIGQSEAYQAEYQQVGCAATYNLQYQETLLKRSSMRREYSLIDRHFRRVGHTRVVLDIPSGDGPREAGVKP